MQLKAKLARRTFTPGLDSYMAVKMLSKKEELCFKKGGRGGMNERTDGGWGSCVRAMRGIYQ